MPGLDISDMSMMSFPVDLSLLKAHKALPRRRDLLAELGSVSPILIPTREPKTTFSSNGINHPTAPSLPLTPPAIPLDPYHHPQRFVSQNPLSERLRDVPGNGTPTHQLSPPTPDNTPPRAVSLLRKREGHNQTHPSMSSRAESFTTAREALSSEEETENVTSAPLLRPSKQKPLDGLAANASPTEAENLSDSIRDDNAAPKDKTRNEEIDPYVFDSFDGQWMQQREAVTAISPPRKKHGRRKYQGDHDKSHLRNAVPQESNVGQPEVSLNREQGSHEGVNHSQNNPNNVSVEEFAEDAGWLSTEDQLDMTERINTWRLSGVSTTSTIEAMVIDSPPQRKRTLRHTEKNSSLRSVSSPIPGSYHDSPVSTAADLKHRLLRKPARITNQDRWSVASDMSLPASVTSNRPPRTQEVIPVVVIPERRSSLRSSNSSSRNHSRARSLCSSRRPTTAPDSGIGYFDIPRQKQRTTSESIPSTCSRDGNRLSGAHPPRTPARSSSFSAPTSRNNSRAASLTSESLWHRRPPSEGEPLQSQRVQTNTGLPQPSTPNPPLEPSAQLTEVNQHPTRQSADDNAILLSPSSQLTPFPPSIQSSSPGAVEISEATAVSLFSHHNRSLLVVERYPQAEPRAVQALHTSPDDLEMTLAEPHTPTMCHRGQSAEMHSPLRNPRPPPKPPAFKIIPPTPLAEDGKRLGHSSSLPEDNNGIIRRFGSVRRALSSRRQSETFSSPWPTRRLRNRKAGKDIDSKLHPFWRPRGFWDDIVDSDSDCEVAPKADPGALGTRRDHNFIISNSLGMPQSRVIFQGPLSIVRRVSQRARVKLPRGDNRSHDKLVSVGKGTSRPIQMRSARRGRVSAVPGLGLQVTILSLRDLQEWLRRIRRRKDLKRGGEKLRKSIGDRVMADGTATVW